MSDFPNPSRFHLPTITSLSRESALGLANGHPFVTPAMANTITAWPTANLAFAVPFTIWAPYLVQSVFWTNASTLAGNVDCGIYSQDIQSLLFNAGSTAQSGTNVPQAVALSTPYLLDPGVYYMVLASSSATAKFVCTAAPTTLVLQATGCGQMAGAGVPLPATLTLATPSSFNTIVPLFGISSRASTLI